MFQCRCTQEQSQSPHTRAPALCLSLSAALFLRSQTHQKHSAEDEDAYEAVGQVFRKNLNKAIGGNKTINESQLDYQPHDEALKKALTGRKR